jgi:hypothetical protein
MLVIIIIIIRWSFVNQFGGGWNMEQIKLLS